MTKGEKKTLAFEKLIPEVKNNHRSQPNEISKSNTLVTSISQKVPLLKSLKMAYSKLGLPGGIYGGDLNTSCIASFFVDMFWHMPKLEELPIEKLIQYCVSNHITRIIPTRDGELLYFAKYKDQLLSKGIHVMISNQPAVQTCLDKVLFFEKVQELGFPGIETKTEVMDLNGQNYVVKERFGAGSCSIGLNLSREQAVTHAISLREPIFQPYHSGTEYSVDVYVDLSGKSKGVVVRERKVVVNGESQVTMTVNNQELEQLCSDLSERLELYGHVVFQVIMDKYGDYHIIECNSRFGGASTLSLRVGLDSFYWFLLESMGIDLSDYPFVRSMNQKTLIRYAEDLFLE
jgi:carbamoyl-phosphate synthase large subunit